MAEENRFFEELMLSSYISFSAWALITLTACGGSTMATKHFHTQKTIPLSFLGANRKISLWYSTDDVLVTTQIVFHSSHYRQWLQPCIMLVMAQAL